MGSHFFRCLKAKEQSINDLAELKDNIEAEIAKLADQLKNKYSLNKDVEVVFFTFEFLPSGTKK